jgi:hypothetical protein
MWRERVRYGLGFHLRRSKAFPIRLPQKLFATMVALPSRMRHVAPLPSREPAGVRTCQSRSTNATGGRRAALGGLSFASAQTDCENSLLVIAGIWAAASSNSSGSRWAAGAFSLASAHSRLGEERG